MRIDRVINSGGLYSWFQTFAAFRMLYAFFWVIPRRLNLICQLFGRLCLFLLHRRVGTYPSMKKEQTECSETLAYKIQTPGNYPEESIKRGFYCFCLHTWGGKRKALQRICEPTLILILLTSRIWWAPNNASKWQMGFNSAFKGLIVFVWIWRLPNFTD